MPDDTKPSLDLMRERYIELLKMHDWQFEYSDDHYAWLRGRSIQRDIEELAKHVDPSREIYNQYAPSAVKKEAA